MKRFVLAVAALTLWAAAPLGAQTPAAIAFKPDDVIMARQAGMALTGGLSDLMKAGVAAGAEVKPFADGAAAMVKWGGVYPTLYPDGTQTGHDTKAKPEIWSDRAGFEKANAAFVAAAEKLAEAAKSGDKAAFAAAFTTTGQSCGGCHRNYKAR